MCICFLLFADFYLESKFCLHVSHRSPTLSSGRCWRVDCCLYSKYRGSVQPHSSAIPSLSQKRWESTSFFAVITLDFFILRQSVAYPHSYDT